MRSGPPLGEGPSDFDRDGHYSPAAGVWAPAQPSPISAQQLPLAADGVLSVSAGCGRVIHPAHQLRCPRATATDEGQAAQFAYRPPAFSGVDLVRVPPLGKEISGRSGSTREDAGRLRTARYHPVRIALQRQSWSTSAHSAYDLGAGQRCAGSTFRGWSHTRTIHDADRELHR